MVAYKDLKRELRQKDAENDNVDNILRGHLLKL